MIQMHLEEGNIPKSIKIKTTMPITVKIDDWYEEELLCVNYTDFRKANFNMGVGSKNGRPYLFRLNYPNEVNIYDKKCDIEKNIYGQGVPIVKLENTDIYPNNSFLGKKISITLYEDALVIIFGYVEEEEFIKIGRLYISKDEYDYIPKIIVEDLTIEEYQGLKQTLEELIIDMKNNPYMEKRPLFKNKIYRLNETQMEEIKSHLIKDEKLYIVDIDGSKIQTELKYLRTIEKEFKFPIAIRPNFDGYLDWITDLMWLNKEGYILIIRNYSKFLKNDIDLKNKIIGDFKRRIQPFWLKDIKEIVVGGKPQRFDLYLVD